MCSQATVTSRAVQIHHSAVLSPSSQEQCSCVITPDVCNTTAKLRFQAVDVRLHNINNNLTECSHESRIEVVGQKERKMYQCEQGKFLHGFEPFHESRENNLVVYLHKKLKMFPQEVWLQISGGYGHELLSRHLK